MKNEEIWKPIRINNKKSSYEISTKGNVRNIITGNVLSSFLSDGYLRVGLKGDGYQKHFNIAVLMLEVFKDKIKNDNLFLYFYDGNRMNLDINNIDLLTLNEICDITYDKLFIKEGNNYILRNGNEDGEIWKRIVLDDIPMHYAISSNGRIINIFSSLFIHPSYPKDGSYPFVILRHHGKSYRFTMHRIVAELFVNNPDPKRLKLVNHKNENKADFKAENLEWCNFSENTLYSLYSGKNKNIGETSINASISNKTAKSICEMLEEGYRVSEIISILGVSRNVVRHIRDGKTWKHVSKMYSFPSKGKYIITSEEKENILKLKELGKTYDEISKITGKSKNTISRILDINDKIKHREKITESVRTRNVVNVLKLYNHDLSVDDISDILGLRKDRVLDIISSNYIL